MNARRTAVAALAALAVALVGGCTDDGGGGTAEPTATASPSPSPTSTPDPSPTPSQTATATATPTPTGGPVEVGAWYLVDTRAGIRLARELRTASGPEPVHLAVELMLQGPSDPDYSTAWNPGTEVLGVTRDGGTIVVDLSEEARTASVGSEGAQIMQQQLVYTATDAADDETAGVLLTIEGEPAGELWGAVTWDEPVMRADPTDVRLLVQIDRPVEGATTSSPVTVTGDALVFEATLQWRVLGAGNAEVASGFTNTSAGQEFAPYSFSVALERGTYTVVIDEGDPSGSQEGGTPMTDTRTITVS
jgi:CBS domain-containing protein